MLSLLKRLNSGNLLPLFAFFKMIAIIFLHFVVGVDVLFVYTTSFIAISVLVRLLTGNPYSFTRKFYHDKPVLFSYYFLNICFALGGVLLYALADPGQALHVAQLIFCVKLLEAVISSRLFFHVLDKNQNPLRDRILITFFAFSVLMFSLLVVEFGLEKALLWDMVFLLGVLVALFVGDFSRLWMRFENLVTVFKSNYEIALTVLPVSLFVIFYSQHDNSPLLGYITLAFSMAGFLNRPLSYLVSSLPYMNYRKLSVVSQLISVVLITMLLSFRNLDYGAHYYLISVLLLMAVVMQNAARLHAFSTTRLSLVKYHLTEAVVIGISFMVEFLVLSFVLLIVTRSLRLWFIQKYE